MKSVLTLNGTLASEDIVSFANLQVLGAQSPRVDPSSLPPASSSAVRLCCLPAAGPGSLRRLRTVVAVGHDAVWVNQGDEETRGPFVSNGSPAHPQRVDGRPCSLSWGSRGCPRCSEAQAGFTEQQLKNVTAPGGGRGGRTSLSELGPSKGLCGAWTRPRGPPPLQGPQLPLPRSSRQQCSQRCGTSQQRRVAVGRSVLTCSFCRVGGHGAE